MSKKEKIQRVKKSYTLPEEYKDEYIDKLNAEIDSEREELREELRELIDKIDFTSLSISDL